MSQVKHVLVDKNKPVTFQAGQQFVVKVAATVVAKIEICSCKADSSTIYAKMVSVVDQSVAKASVFDANMNFLKTGYLRGKAIYQVVEEPTTPVYGVTKTVFDQTAERYIVWSPGSRQPPRQFFVSAKQARFVAYRLSEQYKGSVFYWAKVEGYAQWGEIPESNVG